jgi:hypothetical protein
VVEDDRSVTMSRRPIDDSADDVGRRPARFPVLAADVPADLAVAERTDPRDQPRVVGACAERTAEPRLRVDARVRSDRVLGVADVGGKTGRRQLREAGMGMRMIADQVTLSCDPSRRLRVRFGPAALQEERRPDTGRRESIEEWLGIPERRGTVRVLGVERQGNPERVYFSTPVMTIPLVKTRWKMTNSMTGMSSVIIVPAWI